MLAANSMEGKAEKFLKRIETLIAEGESAKGTYLAECKERNSDIKAVYTEADDAGVPKKALKGIIKRRAMAKKMDAIDDGFDIDEASAYATLVEALGELGRAAAVAAGHATNGNGRADEAALAQVGQG